MVLVCGVYVVNGLIVLFQAEGGIRYLVRSRGRGDVYKRQAINFCQHARNRPPGAGDHLDDEGTGENAIFAQNLSLIHI